MSQNSEQIEAKLCAYLEGELDDAGRAEIEKHLLQNPSHRKLLAEVGRTRDLLRALPREQAPPDICEAFQGQLERSVLLADLDDENGAAAMKVSRWPQYLAAAAVVMLAAGLGLIVYFGLPSGRDENYAITSGGTTGGSTAATSPTVDGVSAQTATPDANASALTRGERGIAPAAGTDAEPEERDKALAQVPAQLRRGGAGDTAGTALGMGGPSAAGAPSGGAQAPVPGAAAATTNPVQDLTALARQVQGSWETKERERLFRAEAGAEATLKALAAVPGDATCYVVTSPRPAQTTQQIARELERLQVAYAAVPRPDDATLHAKMQRSLTLGDAGVAQGGIAAGGTAVGAETPVAQDIAPSRGPTRGGAGGVESINQDAAAGAQPAPGELTDTAPAPAPAPAPTQAPTDPAPTRFGAAAREEEFAARPAEPTRADRYQQVNAGRTETLIVARSLTRQQADALKNSLGGRVIEQQVRLQAGTDVATLDAAQNAVPDAEPQAPGAAGKVTMAGRDTAAGTGTGGGEGAQSGAGAPTAAGLPPRATGGDAVIREGDALRVVTANQQGGQAVSELRVGQDGSVAVPGLGTFQCAGLTVRQFQEQLANDSRAAKSDAPGQLVEVARMNESPEAAPAAPATREALAMAPTADEPGRAPREADAPQAFRSRGAPSRATRGRDEGPALAEPPAPAPAPTASPTASPTPAPAPAAPAEGTVPSIPPAGERPAEGEGRGGSNAVAQQPDAAPPAPAMAGEGESRQYARQQAAPPPAAAPETMAAAPDEQRVDVVILVKADRPAGDADATAAAPAEPAGPIERFEILSVQLGDAEADTVNVRVGEDGTIDLPKLGRVQAENLSADALRQRIAERLRENTPSDAKPVEVVVKRFSPSAAAEGDAPAPAETQPGQPPAPEQQPSPPQPEQPPADGVEPEPAQAPRE